MAKSTSKKRSWYYWMYEYSKEISYGSLMPDFDVGLLTQKQFLAGMRGQTIHTLTEKEFAELKKLANTTDTSKIPFFIKEARKGRK